MKNLAAAFVALCFVFALVSIGLAGGMKVEGMVESMEGGFVTVKDAKGMMHKLHTNESTKMMGEVKVGSEVEAMATGDGHAMSIMVKGGMGMKDDMKHGMGMKDDMKGGMKGK